MGTHGARVARGARGNSDKGDDDNHQESVMRGGVSALGGNIWVIGGVPPTVISGVEFK